ncbi:MAG TPA: diphthine--ammonia ligase [Chitinophagaceae bacterium]|nr:diphthine--ammonia ligase [Chitinophagaceae bacterium]
MNKSIACSWSGGKDSCFALMQAVLNGAVPALLVNMMNENGRISRSHGLPASILQQQAAAMQLPIITRPSSWQDYETNFVDVLKAAVVSHSISAMVFGDIDLQAHRDWEEMVCSKAGIEALLPLWQQPRRPLVYKMMDAGIEAMIVSCNTTLGDAFLGRFITPELIPLLEAKGVDVCGENGEFHTVVVNCPLFEAPISLPSYSKILHDNYWFLQWPAQ